MRAVVILLFLIGVLSDGICQEYYASSSSPGEITVRKSPLFLVSSSAEPVAFDNVVLPPGYRMKRVGSSLTIAGAAFFVGGIVFIANADEAVYNSTTGLYDFDPNLFLGSFMLVGGVGMMVPGIIFWVKGAKRYNRYLENLQASIKTKGAGLCITMKF